MNEAALPRHGAQDHYNNIKDEKQAPNVEEGGEGEEDEENGHALVVSEADDEGTSLVRAELRRGG